MIIFSCLSDALLKLDSAPFTLRITRLLSVQESTIALIRIYEPSSLLSCFQIINWMIASRQVV